MMLNNARRRQIRAIIKKLQKDNLDIDVAISKLEDILSDEEDARDNTPESLQESERYQVCEESCDLLEQAIDELSNEDEADIEEVLNTLAQIDCV